jgi:hypothetical protein
MSAGARKSLHPQITAEWLFSVIGAKMNERISMWLSSNSRRVRTLALT